MRIQLATFVRTPRSTRSRHGVITVHIEQWDVAAWCKYQAYHWYHRRFWTVPGVHRVLKRVMGPNRMTEMYVRQELRCMRFDQLSTFLVGVELNEADARQLESMLASQ